MQNQTFQDRGIALSREKKSMLGAAAANPCVGGRGGRREDEKIKPFLLHFADGSAKKGWNEGEGTG